MREKVDGIVPRMRLLLCVKWKGINYLSLGFDYPGCQALFGVINILSLGTLAPQNLVQPRICVKNECLNPPWDHISLIQSKT